MKPFFNELFEYNYHFNQELAGVFLENSDKTSQKAIKLMSHILNAHQVWNNRIKPNQTTFGIWEVHPVQNFKEIDRLNYEYSLALLENLDLNDTFEYKNSKGKPFKNSIQEVLFHIINHSTYHRAQIATEFRQIGIEPLVTDYAIYKR